ncbi:putative vicilin-like antimicrobial peptides 2-2-like [Capsicum annuum]|nr:putative vicilin-like antimicrobial peptides 2-2-like [Capsicum annuum]KAF3645493.1 putative vicilin-like antimicrobial peptides 2-2-like [Capsicum annuum]
MGNRRTLLFLVLVLFSALVASVCAYEYEEKESKQRTQGEKWFLLRQLHNVVKTDAGSMRMVKGVHIYIVQCILVSSPWNLIVSSSLSTLIPISFFIGGGVHPVSVLAGFDHNTLSTALNVSTAELRTFLTRQSSGPIVHLSGSHDTNTWSKFLNLESHQKLAHLKRIVNFQDEASPKEEESTWSLRKILFTLLNREDVVHIAYNLYNRKPDFRNDYGWIKKLDEFDYSPLRQSGNVVYLGSMMAPHVNPTAIEYGIVLKGTGRIQIVYPNGTLAMNAGVREGDVFWVPRYFPFCQTASTNGPFQIAGFTTSARRNHPQFLVGRNSLMQSLRGPEFAAAFGIGEKRLKRITNAQHELVILPSSSAAPADLV